MSPAPTPPTPALPEGVVLLDGGMGQELERRRSGPGTDLWSAQAMLDEPGIVLAVHRDYIAAGARVITTNSYGTTRTRLEPAGVGDRFVALNRLAGELAVQARDEAGQAVLVAGSLPPLQDSYRVDRIMPFDRALPLYREQADLLAPYVDLFLCETMASAEEARAAASAAAATGKPVWVGWTLQDGGSPLLRSGETIAQAGRALEDLPVGAFLANCCSPESITAAMPALARLGTAGGYANGFVAVPEGWAIDQGLDKLGHREDIDPETYLVHARAWIDAGARIVGGCCEIGPAHIARLNQALVQAS